MSGAGLAIVIDPKTDAVVRTIDSVVQESFCPTTPSDHPIVSVSETMIEEIARGNPVLESVSKARVCFGILATLLDTLVAMSSFNEAAMDADLYALLKTYNTLLTNVTSKAGWSKWFGLDAKIKPLKAKEKDAEVLQGFQVYFLFLQAFARLTPRMQGDIFAIIIAIAQLQAGAKMSEPPESAMQSESVTFFIQRSIRSSASGFLENLAKTWASCKPQVSASFEIEQPPLQASIAPTSFWAWLVGGATARANSGSMPSAN